MEQLTRRCTKCGVEYPATNEYFYWNKHHNQFYSRCKSCHSEIAQIGRTKWLKEHPENIKQWQKTYYESHRDEILAKKRQPKELERALTWAKNNPEKHALKEQRRRARKQNLPDTFTFEELQHCLEYHHFCCAVCGHQLNDLFGQVELHLDHWIPLSSPNCPGTVVTNMLCLCGYCNKSKRNKLPSEWLIWKFGKRKAQQILERINQYFASLPK